MLDARKNDADRASFEPLLFIEGLEQAVEQRALEDVSPRPNSRLRRVPRQKRAWLGRVREFNRAAVRDVARRQLALVASLAVELDAEPRAAPGFGQNPRPLAHRRIVAHVLTEAAFELRDPVRFLVSMEPDDLALHGFASLTSFR